MTMKDQVKAQGGYFLCAFRARDGRKSDRCLVRAHSAREARKHLRKILGCALLAFTVKAVCP